MNHENESPPTPSTPGDAELEAQIVAWVAGEASPFLIAALESAIAARPELAVFKRRIEAVHGLVSVAARPDAEPLRLAPERRAKLLKAIGVNETTTAAEPMATATPPKAKVLVMTRAKKAKPPFWTQNWFYSAAACVAFGAILFVLPLAEQFSFETKTKAIPLELPSAACLSPSDGGWQEEESARLPEPMISAGYADHASVSDSRKFAGEAITQLRAEAEAASTHYKREKTSAENDRRVFGALSFDAQTLIAPGAAPAKQLAERQRAPSQSSVHDNRSTPQPAAPAVGDGKEVVALSPFVVSAKENKGYAATTTLAGTRLRTEVRDIGSSISVVSKEFLKYTGATDNKSLLEYTTGGEVGGTQGNFLSKRKAERPASKLAGKGRAIVPPSPAAPHAEEDIVVLSPFEVSKSPDFLKKTSRSSGEKRSKRPTPMATVGMGLGGLNPESINAGLEQATSDQPVIQVEEFAAGAPAAKADDKPPARPAPKPLPPVSIEEVSAAQEAVSTFSLHVSDVSFKLALAALASGTWPDRATIRPEEFYNAFDYGDPATAASEKISCRIEQAAHPFAQQRNLVRIAMRVPATGRGAGQPLHLTVLLDTSGSMERPDRRATVRAALATLVGLLGPADRLTVIGFARQPRLLAEALDGNHANQALDLLDRTPAEGGTNLEEALKLGSELASRQFLATAQNRIVLLTDGAANLGDADPDRLATAVEALRAQRIAFDACGVGLDGLDDTILEALTRKGDGRYYVLNSPEMADADFARQLAGAFRPAAENVKVQVRFNPARVGHYRLVGFEKHRLREEDFRNDAVDAAELAAEEAAVAVYEIEAKPQGEGEVGEVFVRFRDATTKEMVERSWTLPYEAHAAAFDRASPSIQLAGTAAMLAEKIRGGPAGDRVELDTLTPIVNALRGRRPDDQRLQELVTMFAQLRRLQGK